MSASENENKKPGGYMHHLPFHPPLTAAQTRDIGWIRQQVADLHDVLPRMKVAETITRKLGPGPGEGLVVEVQNGGRDMARALTYLRAFHATAELAIAGGPPMPDSQVECKMDWEEADAENARGGGVTPTVGAQQEGQSEQSPMKPCDGPLLAFRARTHAILKRLDANGNVWTHCPPCEPLPFGEKNCAALTFLKRGGVLKFEPTSEKGCFICEDDKDDPENDVIEFQMPKGHEHLRLEFSVDELPTEAWSPRCPTMGLGEEHVCVRLAMDSVPEEEMLEE